MNKPVKLGLVSISAPLLTVSATGDNRSKLAMPHSPHPKVGVTSSLSHHVGGGTVELMLRPNAWHVELAPCLSVFPEPQERQKAPPFTSLYKVIQAREPDRDPFSRETCGSVSLANVIRRPVFSAWRCQGT